MRRTKKIVSLLLAIAMVIPMAFSAAGGTVNAAQGTTTISASGNGKITATVDGHSSVIRNDSETIDASGDASISVEPDDGYVIDAINIVSEYGENEINDVTTSYESVVTEDIESISVTFVKKPTDIEEEDPDKYGSGQGTVRVQVVGSGGTASFAGGATTVTGQPGEGFELSINPANGYMIDYMETLNSENQVIEVNHMVSSQAMVYVEGGETTTYKVYFVEEPADEYDGQPSTRKIKIVHKNNSKTNINGHATYQDKNDGTLFYCIDMDTTGPSDVLTYKLKENHSKQRALDYVMYYGYPNTTKISGKKLSARDAHDVTQLAVWAVFDGMDSLNRPWNKSASTAIKRLARQLATRALAYDGSNSAVNGSAALYFPSSKKRQGMVTFTGKKPGVAKVKKVSKAPVLTNGNSCYNLAGAKYTLYTDAACRTIAKDINGNNAVLETNSSGNSNEVSMAAGSYYVKETQKASKGYARDTHIYTVTVSGGSTATINAQELPFADPISVLLRKISKETGKPVAQAGASLAGAVFELTLTETNQKWTLTTPKSGIINKNNLESCINTTAGLYKVNNNWHFPLGHYALIEKTAPEGYLKNDETFTFEIKEQSGSTFEADASTNYVFPINQTIDDPRMTADDQVKRGDIMLKKVDEAGEPIALCPFLVVETVGDAKEAHIVVTNNNGIYRSASTQTKHDPKGYYDHDYNTNANDDYVTWQSDGTRVVDDPLREDDKMVVDESHLTYQSGTWFSFDQNGEASEPNNEMGAFPYSGSYKFKEVRSSANEDWSLISFGVDNTELADEDSGTLDLGTKIDRTIGLNTTASDKNTNSRVSYMDTEATVVDKVEYSKLKKGEKYTLRGELHIKNTDGSDGGVFVDPDGKTVTAEKKFTADKADSSTELEFTFNSVGYDGRQFVVFEKLYDEAGEELLSEHQDITDSGQTIEVEKPSISTTAEDAATDSHTGMPSKETTIVDTVKYKNLTVGKEYTVKGVLHLKGRENGKVVDKGILKDKSGKPVEASKTFIAEKKEGIVEITFTFDSSLLSGETVVAFEKLYRDNYEIAVHEDISDKDQSVSFPVPQIGTTALDKESGTHTAKAEQNVELVDTVKWEDLAPGTYSMNARIWDATDEKFIEGATGSTEFEVKDGETKGSVKVSVKVNTSGLKGHRLVFFEQCVRGASDEPAISTMLTDDKDMQNVLGGEAITLTDTVAYSNLEKGETYTLICTVKDKASTEVLGTAAHTFKADDTSGTEKVEITVNASSSNAAVAFEKLYKGEVAEETEETPIATHEDLSDAAQTVVISDENDLRTTLTTKDDGKTIPAEGEVSLVDKVAYSGLTAGEQYTLKCVIRDKTTDSAVGTETVTFTAQESGIQEVSVAIPSSGHTLVAFEYLYAGSSAEGTPIKTHENINDTAQSVTVEKTNPDSVVAKHEDADDEGQTVFVSPVTLHTTLKDKDGDKKISPTKNTELTDTVIYTGLTRGKQYTMVCRIMDKKTKKEVGTASILFTPQDANGTVDVPIELDTTKLKGKSLVAFERCYIGEKPSDENLVALHEDLNDKSQTVVVNGGVKNSPPSLKTGDRRAWMILILFIIMVAGGTTLVVMRKRKN